jgi:hypothetical protein
MKKTVTLYANFSHPDAIKMVKAFEEAGYEVNQIYSASSLPILIDHNKNMWSGYGHILSQFGLFKSV